MLWTDEQTAELKRRWANNESARQIALCFNVSRNSVLGKIHRLGLSTPVVRKPIIQYVKAQRNGGAAKEALKAIRARERKIARLANQSPLTNVVLARARAMGELPSCDAIELPQESIARPPVALLDLERHHCRWPIEHDGVVMFCGADKHTGAYCARHAALAYRPFEERKITGREIDFLRAEQIWKIQNRRGIRHRPGWRA